MTAEGADFIDIGACPSAPYLVTKIFRGGRKRGASPRRSRIVKSNTDADLRWTRPDRPGAAGLEAGASSVERRERVFLTDPGAAQNRQGAKACVFDGPPQGSQYRMLEKPGGRRQKAAERALKRARSFGIPPVKIVWIWHRFFSVR